jgi:chromosome segregation ATPase
MRELNEIVSQRDKEITRVQKELDMLVSIEIPKLTDAVEARDQEIAALREKNKALIAQMKIELMKLLDKQKADCEAIDTLKQKVASYSSKIVELQGQIAEYGMADAAALEAELNKLSLMNEQLQSKLAEMEKEMLEATRKAESLMSSLKEADEDEPEREISLQEKIDAAAKEIEVWFTVALQFRTRAKLPLLTGLHDVEEKDYR